MCIGASAQITGTLVTGYGDPLTLTQFKALAGTTGRFAFVASSNTAANNAPRCDHWCGFTSTYNTTTLSEDYLFYLEASGDNYKVKRASDGKYVSTSTSSTSFVETGGSEFKLVNRDPTDATKAVTGEQSISFEDPTNSNNHYNANAVKYNGGAGAWTTFAVFGPFYIVTVNCVDESDNALRTVKYIVKDGDTFTTAPNVGGYKAKANPNVTVSGTDEIVKVTYENAFQPSANKGYKLKMKGTDLYVKFCISGYTETDAANATLLASEGSIFKLSTNEEGYTLKWQNEYMKTSSSWGWNTGHGTDSSNSTWYIEAVDGEANTYYIKKSSAASGSIFFGNKQDTPSADQYLYTDQDPSKATNYNVKWVLEETTMNERMVEQGYWPETSTSLSPQYYTIKNTRCGKYAKYTGDGTKMALVSERLESTANAFWFEAVAEGGLPDDVLAVKIHNKKGGKCVAATNSFTDDGITWYLKADVYTGTTSIAINSNSATWDDNSYGWNNEGGNNLAIANWKSTDVGSAWWVDEVTSDDMDVMEAVYTRQIEALKEDGIALTKVSTILFGAYDTDDTPAHTAYTTISGVSSATNTPEAVASATSTINSALNTMYAAMSDKKIVFKNTFRSNKYMVVTDAVQLGGAAEADGRSEFKINYVSETNGQFTIQNTVTGRYIANTPAASNRIQLSTTGGKFTIKPSGTDNMFAFVCVSPTNATHNSIHLDGSSNVVAWEAYPDNASTWVIEASALTAEQISAGVTAVRNQAITKIQSYKSGIAGNVGSGLNQYTATSAYNTAATAIDNATNTQEYETLLAMQETYKTAYNALSINQPSDGSFIRVRSVKTGTTSGKGYINAVASADRGGCLAVGDKGTSSIYYYKDGKLLAYNCGQYLIKNDNGSGFLGLGTTGTSGAAIVFGRGTKQQGTYYVTFAGRYLYAGDAATSTNAGGSEEDNNCDFWLEEVDALPVTISSVGYATLYSPVALTIPSGVTAYVATDEGEYLHLDAIKGTIIPANTGVILAGSAGTYNFDITTGGSVDSNALTGTVAAISRPTNSYILSTSGGANVGFYKDGASTIPGFKAYLAAAGGSVKMFCFDDDETGVVSPLGETKEGTAIYNLSGQRLNKMQKGINIVNGKKVLF